MAMTEQKKLIRRLFRETGATNIPVTPGYRASFRGRTIDFDTLKQLETWLRAIRRELNG